MNKQNRSVVRTMAAMKVYLAPCFADNCLVTNLDMLQFAHLKPTKLSGPKRGRSKRLQDILNHPDCYTMLCEDHHQDYDVKGTHSWTPKSVLDRANELQVYLFRSQILKARIHGKQSG